MGLEAALGALERGFAVTVLEKGRVGESFRRYGPTRLFSPFAMNVSARARALLGARAPGAEELLTGQEMADRVLEPLAAMPPLAGRVRTGHAVTAIGRARMTRGEMSGHPLRGERPFRLLVETPRGEEVMKGTSSLDEALALDDQLLLRLRALAPRSQEQKKQPATAPVTPAQPCRDDDGFDAANAMLAGGDDEVAGDVVATPSAPTGIQPPHYWTLRVLAGGFSAEECLQIRALDRATLIKHVLAIAREGGEWQLNWIFAPERQDALERVMSNGAAQSLAAVLSRLPPGITPEEAELFWLARHASSTTKS
jgi:hypothetical protein